MAIRFAGSRFLDERRRRRLVSESGDGIEAAADPPQGRPAANSLRIDEVPRNAVAGELPYRRLISPRLWKHFGVGCLGCSLAVAILAAGYYESRVEAAVGPGVGRLFSLSTARVITCFNSVALLLAAQTAVLIYWVRSKSLRDFVGRYRIWAWTAVAWTLFAGTVATDAHLAFSETLIWLWDARFWQKDILCWMLPAALAGCLVLRWLKRDMCGCRASLSLLWLAAAGYLFSSLLKLEVVVVPAAWMMLALTGTFMFASLFLFMSMLLHARHVIYKSCETPDVRPSRITTCVRRMVRVDSLVGSWRPRSSKAAVSPDSAAAETAATGPEANADAVNSTEADQAIANAPQTANPGTSAEPSARAISESVPPDPEPSDNPAGAAEVAAEVVEKSAAAELSLKGLSKKQRRRLRKQHRQNQRTAAR